LEKRTKEWKLGEAYLNCGAGKENKRRESKVGTSELCSWNNNKRKEVG
jgi:hypothetical protein